MNTSLTVKATGAWLQLIRAPAVFTAVSNIVAAHLIANGGSVDWPVFIVLSLSSCALYTAGMALNDCFDQQEDARERPERPLPAGRVSPTAAWTYGWTALLAGIFLAALNGRQSLIIGLLLALAIITYNAWSKDTWLGAPNMGICRYLNWLLGLSVVVILPGSSVIALPILLYVTSLTLISRVEARAESKLPLIASAAGFSLTAVAIGALYIRGDLTEPAAPVLACIALIVVLGRILNTVRNFAPASVQATVGFLVLGIIPLDALMLAGAGHWWGSFAVLMLIIPGRLLGRWMYVT